MTRNWVLAHESENQAFRRFAEIYPVNCCPSWIRRTS